MAAVLILLVLNLGWTAHQQRQINALPSVVDRLEHAAERLERIHVQAHGGTATIHLRTPLTPEEIEHIEHERAMHAVWLANYGQEVADAMLHSRRERPAPAGERPGTGGP